MESRSPEDSKNVNTSQAYFFEGFISFFEDFSLTIVLSNGFGAEQLNMASVFICAVYHLKYFRGKAIIVYTVVNIFGKPHLEIQDSRLERRKM